jgi:hypothetical protein
VASTVTVALVGDPVPIGAGSYPPADLEVAWSERQKVDLEVRSDETAGEILGRAAEAFGLGSAGELDESLWPGATLADAFGLGAISTCHNGGMAFLPTITTSACRGPRWRSWPRPAVP